MDEKSLLEWSTPHVTEITDPDEIADIRRRHLDPLEIDELIDGPKADLDVWAAQSAAIEVVPNLPINPSLRAALDSAKAGLYVFKLPLAKKAPPPERFYDVATTDPSKIRRMWTSALGDEFEEHNIGFAVGIRHVALDFDVKKTDLKSLSRSFEEKYGALPPTVVVQTPSGGVHFIFSIPEGLYIANSASKLLPGVDVRGHHGYTVAPGSYTEKGAYKWLPGFSPTDRKIAEFPQSLIGACQAASGAARPPTEKLQVRGELDEPEQIERARQWLRTDAPAAIEDAGGHTAMNQVIHGLLDRGLSPDTVVEEMLEHWAERCSRIPEPEYLREQVHSLLKSRRSPIGSARELNPAEVFEAVTLEKPKRRWQTAEEAAEAALANPPRRLIEGLLDCGATTILFGPSNAGKTAVALSMADAIAAGTAWGGRKTETGLVFYVAAEGGPGVRRRVAALMKEHKRSKLKLAVLTEPIALFRQGNAWKLLREDIHAAEEEFGSECVLVVIDTVSITMAGMDENDASQVSEMFQGVGALKHDIGCAVLLLHHTGKDASKGERGSYALRANADISLEITEAAGGMGELHSRKQRDNEKEEAIRFKVEGTEIGTTPDGTRITAAIARICGKEEAWRLDLTSTEQLLFDALTRVQARRAEAGEASENAPVSTADWNAELATDDDNSAASKGRRADSTLREHRLSLIKKSWIKRVDRNSWVCS